MGENRDYTMFAWSVQGASTPIHIVRGEGSCFWDGDGNRWLDFSSQLINLNVGHQHPKMLEAIKKQVDELCFAGPNLATEPRGVLGKKLAETTGLAKSFYTLGGAEAVENAMKIAKLYTGRSKIITRYRSYHGATMGGMTASGEPRRWPVEPGIPGIVRVFDPYCYRCPFGKTPDSCRRECVSHIEEIIQMENPAAIAAIMVEGITGSNGILVPPDDYYPKLRALCDKYNILLIDDEVMSGFGRTGKWLATQHYGIKPDIVTCAKGLTSGYMPLGAVIVSKPIADYFETHMLWGGLTYSGHPVSCAAADREPLHLRRRAHLRKRGPAGRLSGPTSGEHERTASPASAMSGTRASSASSNLFAIKRRRSPWRRSTAPARRWRSLPPI